MDRVLEEMFIFLGGSIGYWQGDVKTLVDDIGELKPTLFAGAPRIFDRCDAFQICPYSRIPFRPSTFGNRSCFQDLAFEVY